MPTDWKTGIIKINTQLWNSLKVLLKNSDSKEKINYYEEFEQHLHPEFYSLHEQSCFALAQCYFNLAVTNLSLKNNYKEAM